jgi:hypothetical protein
VLRSRRHSRTAVAPQQCGPAESYGVQRVFHGEVVVLALFQQLREEVAGGGQAGGAVLGGLAGPAEEEVSEVFRDLG